MKLNDKEIIEFKNLSTNATIDWVLGNYCNYKCSYCFPHCNTGTVRLPKINGLVKNNIRHIVDQLKLSGMDSVVFNLAGGEPTLYHDFDNLANFLHSLGQISIVTNGSRTLRWWKEHVHLLDKVTISYHSEFTDIDKLIEILDFLDEKVNLSVHVMINPVLLFEKCINVHNLLQEKYKEHNFFIVPKLLRDVNNKMSSLYTEEQLKTLSNLDLSSGKKVVFKNLVKRRTEAKLEDGSIENVIPLMIKNLHGSWKGYRCSAHHEFLQINMNGSLGRLSCGQHYARWTNIFHDDFIGKFVLPRNQLICERDNCGCMGLLVSGKQK